MKIREKRATYKSAYGLYEGQKLTLNDFKSGIFPIKQIQRKELKILTPKQMLQSLPIALAQGKASKTSKNLLNEIRQIIYSYIFVLSKRNY